jgi:hypothetical protein
MEPRGYTRVYMHPNQLALEKMADRVHPVGGGEHLTMFNQSVTINDRLPVEGIFYEDTYQVRTAIRAEEGFQRRKAALEEYRRNHGGEA